MFCCTQQQLQHTRDIQLISVFYFVYDQFHKYLIIFAINTFNFASKVDVNIEKTINNNNRIGPHRYLGYLAIQNRYLSPSVYQIYTYGI